MFLLGAIILCFLLPVLMTRSLEDAYHQNPKLAKLPPLSECNYLKVMRNTDQRSPYEGHDPFRYLPYDELTFEEDYIIIRLGDYSERVHLANAVYRLSDATLNELNTVRNGQYRFMTLLGAEIDSDRNMLSSLVKEEHLVHKRFVLGTDQLGRDILSRLLVGGRLSLSLALVAILITVIVGVSLGVLAGYFGGWLSRILTWLLGLFWSIPAVLFVVIIALALVSARFGVMIGITSVLWVEMAQVIKSRVQSIKDQEYVKASRLIGLSHWRIIKRHILPNVTSPIYVIVAGAFADALMLEAGLSFLGVGITPPHPSWGNMIRTSYGYMLTENYAFMAVVPSVALLLVVLASVFLSNGLKKVLEVDYRRIGNSEV